MKKKQTKHFVQDKDYFGDGNPACHCFRDPSPMAYAALDEVAKTRRGVTCGNCKRTRVFRGEVFRGEK